LPKNVNWGKNSSVMQENQNLKIAVVSGPSSFLAGSCITPERGGDFNILVG
jgi:hypothetical protein